MLRKVSFLLILVLIVGGLATGCGKTEAPIDEGNGDENIVADTSLIDLQARGVLVIGCDDAFPPMGFVGDDGAITGFDIELGQMVAEKLGVKAEAKPIDWSAKELELKGGKIDVIWNGYTIDKARNQQVEFTKPYLYNEQVLVVAADSPYQTKADLAGKVVGAQVDSSGLKSLLKANKAFADTLKDIPEYEDYLYALLDLGTSRLDAAAVDKILIGYQMQQNPGKYRVLDEVLGSEYYGIGCAKGAVALREAIDQAIDDLWDDGSIETLATKWFGENLVIRDVDKLTDADL